MNKKKLSKQGKLSPILKMEKSPKFTCTILFRSFVAAKSSTSLKIYFVNILHTLSKRVSSQNNCQFKPRVAGKSNYEKLVRTTC